MIVSQDVYCGLLFSVKFITQNLLLGFEKTASYSLW